MPDKDMMIRIRAREEQYAWSALDAYQRGLVAGMDSMPGEQAEAIGLRDALANLAEAFRASAEDYAAAKLKGAQTAHVIPLRNAAQQLDVVIKQLDQPRRAPLGQVQPVSAPPAIASIAPLDAGLDEPVHRFVPGPDGRTCGAGIERDGTGEPCGRFPSHPAHRIVSGDDARPSLDALISEASGMTRVVSVDMAGPIEGEALGVTPEQLDDTAKMAADLRDRVLSPAAVHDDGVDPRWSAEMSGEDVAAYLRGEVDTLPGTVAPTAQVGAHDATAPTSPADSLAALADTTTAPPITSAREILETSVVTIPPVPMLGQPGDMGAGYAPSYVPVGAVPMTYNDLMTPVAAAVLPPHLSHSQIETLGDCPAKYRGSRLGGTTAAPGVIEIPQWANIGGSAFHSAVEQVELWAAVPGAAVAGADMAETLWREHFDAEILRIEQSQPVPRDRWRAANKGAEHEAWWNANGPEMIRRYLAARPDQSTLQVQFGDPATGQTTVAIEWEVEALVPTPYGPVPYKAIIDRVTWDERRGAYIIRDYKSGKRAPDDTSQLGEYAHMLRLAGKVFADAKIYGTFFDARKGEWTPEVDLLDAWPLDWFVYRVTSAYAQKLALTTGPTPARPSSFCGGCSVRYACPIKGVRK